MWNILLGIWFMVIVPIIIVTQIPDDNTLFLLVSVGSGLAFIIIGSKQVQHKEKVKRYIKAIEKNFDLIVKKLDNGKSLEVIAEELSNNQKIPPIITVKFGAGIVNEVVNDNLIGSIIEEDNNGLFNKLGVVHQLSDPFINNTRSIQEEIFALNEYENIFYQQEKVTLSEYRAKEKVVLGNGTMILTTRYLLWFPTKVSFKKFIRDSKTQDLITEITKNFGLLGLGVNSAFLIDALVNIDKAESKYTQEEKNKLYEIASNEEKFRAISLDQIQKIEFEPRFLKRITNKSVKLFTVEGEKYELNCLEGGSEFVADMFEQIKMVGLLHNRIFIPEDMNEPGVWTDFYSLVDAD